MRFAPAKMDEDREKKEVEEEEDVADGEEEEDSDNNRLLRRLGINPNLLMLKVTLFVMYGATASLLPYLTIHMQSIGLTVPEISFVYLALPFTTFLSPPITGQWRPELAIRRTARKRIRIFRLSRR